MSNYPKEIAVFHQTIERLKGIGNVESGIETLDGIEGDELSNAEYHNLPIATLLRTDGGIEDEVITQFEFTIDKSPESLISLEFLSWFVRDKSSGGIPVQLRTFAFPPQTPDGIQLGQTLKFCIDYFIEDVSESLQPILDKISALNNSLELAIQIYNIPTKN
ncbi:hypothetical protein [Taibaiella soli]|uniref:Uncharacterized protein n=1 Tax=Taibaiella soli TaxID=1649169 RepID=A0A2W2B0C7_9BACT|nr:hypothetical protein [Taibaiella soli]PZF73714.1 hypothetical protein DN068_06880 [Taibaiella soli]